MCVGSALPGPCGGSGLRSEFSIAGRVREGITSVGIRGVAPHSHFGKSSRADLRRWLGAIGGSAEFAGCSGRLFVLPGWVRAEHKRFREGCETGGVRRSRSGGGRQPVGRALANIGDAIEMGKPKR